MNAIHLSTAEQIRDAVARLRPQLLKHLERYVNLETPSDAPELLSAALPRIEQMITEIAGAPATRTLSEHEGYGPHIVLEFPGSYRKTIRYSPLHVAQPRRDHQDE